MCSKPTRSLAEIAEDLRLYAPSLRARALQVGRSVYRDERDLAELIARAAESDLPTFASELEGHCVVCAEVRARAHKQTLIPVLLALLTSTDTSTSSTGGR